MALPVDLYFQALENLPEYVFLTSGVIGESGPILLYSNKAFKKISGYNCDELKEKKLGYLDFLGVDKNFVDNLSKSLTSAGNFTGYTKIYKEERGTSDYQWEVYPLLSSSENAEYYLFIIKDITEQKDIMRRSKDLQKLWDIVKKVSVEGHNLDEVRQRVVEVAMEISGAESAVVEEPEKNEMVYRAVCGGASDSLGLRLPKDKSLSGLTYKSLKTVVCEDSQLDDRVVLKEKALVIGFRSAVISPLLHKNMCYGVLKVYSRYPGNFNKDDKQLLELSSNVLASALCDAAAFDEEIKKRQLLLDAVPIFIAYIDLDGRFVEVNSAHEKLLLMPISEIRGKKISDILDQENYDRIRPYLDGALKGDSVSFEVNAYDHNNVERTYKGNLEPHKTGKKSGKTVGCYAAFQDITEIKLAESDYLTGLLNRRKFQELAEFLLQSRNREGSPVSLIMLDIDHFKQVNDKHGHLTGDEVLKKFADLLYKSARKTDLVGRWGGEEFLVFLYNSGLKDAENYSARLLQEIRTTTFDKAGKITASIGIAEAAEDETLLSLQGKADKALYMAKNKGRDCFALNQSC